MSGKKGMKHYSAETKKEKVTNEDKVLIYRGQELQYTSEA